MIGCRFLLTLWAAMLLPASVPAEVRTENGSLRLRCEVAMAYVRDLAADPSLGGMIFSDASGLFPRLGDDAWWAEGAEPPVQVAPPEELAARMWAEGGPSAVRNCGALRLFLAAHGYRYGRDAIRDHQRLPSRARHRTVIVHLTLPVLSQDRRRAVFQFLHGGANVLLVERQADGRWRVIAYEAIAVF